MVVTKKEFEEMVAEEAKINWKVKKLLEQHGSYDNLPENIKDLLHRRLGVVRIDAATFTSTTSEPQEAT